MADRNALLAQAERAGLTPEAAAAKVDAYLSKQGKAAPAKEPPAKEPKAETKAPAKTPKPPTSTTGKAEPKPPTPKPTPAPAAAPPPKPAPTGGPKGGTSVVGPRADAAGLAARQAAEMRLAGPGDNTVPVPGPTAMHRSSAREPGTQPLTSYRPPTRDDIETQSLISRSDTAGIHPAPTAGPDLDADAARAKYAARYAFMDSDRERPAPTPPAPKAAPGAAMAYYGNTADERKADRDAVQNADRAENIPTSVMKTIESVDRDSQDLFYAWAQRKREVGDADSSITVPAFREFEREFLAKEKAGTPLPRENWVATADTPAFDAPAAARQYLLSTGANAAKVAAASDADVVRLAAQARAR